MSRVTLEDVANACGVSKATASYVLNNKPASFGLSAATVRRVLEESRKLNYRPDLVARLLESQKRNVLKVCVFSPWLHSQFSDFMAQFSAAIEAAMQEQKLSVEYRFYKASELKKVLKSSLCRKYDACIVLGTREKDNQYLIKKVDEFSNIILLNRNLEKFPCVYGSDMEICEEIGKKLISAGFYSKYVICSNIVVSDRENLRLEGYRKAFSNADATWEEYGQLANGKNFENEMKKVIDQHGSNRVCYCFLNYLSAAAMLNAAYHRGISIPSEIGIVGYDQHSLLKNFLVLQLTTVEPRVFEMVTQALRMARTLKSGEKINSVRVESELIAGNTAVIK